MVAKEILSPPEVRARIEASLPCFLSGPETRERQIAFYGGSFTALNREDQIAYLKEVQAFLSSGRIDSIRLSTRPDALDEGTLEILKTYGVKTIEVGVQSMFDEILLHAQRGHCAEESASAIRRLKDWRFEVGVHLMIGLPGDTLDYFLRTLDRIIALQADFVRIHPTLVFRGAPLETLWRRKQYRPLSLKEAVQWLKKGVLKLEKAFLPPVRIGLQPTQELEEHLLAGPFHPALHQLVDSAIFYDMAKELLQSHLKDSEPVFICHPKDLSNLRGQRNENIQRLKNQFRLRSLSILCNQVMERGRLGLQMREGMISIERLAF